MTHLRVDDCACGGEDSKPTAPTETLDGTVATDHGRIEDQSSIATMIRKATSRSCSRISVPEAIS